MIAYAVSVPHRPVPPQVEALLEDAVFAARDLARDPAKCAAVLEAVVVTAELISTHAPSPARIAPEFAPLLGLSFPKSAAPGLVPWCPEGIFHDYCEHPDCEEYMCGLDCEPAVDRGCVHGGSWCWWHAYECAECAADMRADA